MKILIQIIQSICFVALYFVMQFVAVFAVTAVCGIVEGLQLMRQGQDMQSVDFEALVESAIYNSPGAMCLITVLSGVLTIVCLYLFFYQRGQKLRTEAYLLPFHAFYWPMVLLGAVGLCLVVNFAMPLIPIPEEVLTEYAEQSQNLVQGPFIYLLISNVVMAPLIEEILFRGLVLNRLRKVMPVWAAVVISSVFFGLMHGQILWIIYTSLVGLILGLTAWKMKSALAPMFMHFVFNLFGTYMGCFPIPITGLLCVSMTALGSVCLIIYMVALFRYEPDAK